MKNLQKPSVLFAICAGAGIAALFVRIWLLRYGTDERELLIASHPANILSFVLTALALLPCAFAALNRPRCNYCAVSPSRPGAAGCGIGCIGLAVSAGQLISASQTVLTVITGIIGLAAMVCLVMISLCRYTGRKPHYLLSGCVLVYLMLLPIQLYQTWSAEPQLPRYFFQLLGSVCTLIWAYQHRALSAGIGCYRTFLLTAAGSVFFCIAAVPGSVQPVFYLTAAAWVLLDSAAVRPAYDDHAAA